MVFVLRKFKNLKPQKHENGVCSRKKSKFKNRKNTKMATLKNGNIQENRKNTKIVIALRKIKNIKNRENIKMVLALRQFKYSRNLQTSKWRRVGENVNIQQFTCQNEQKHQHDRRSQKKLT